MRRGVRQAGLRQIGVRPLQVHLGITNISNCTDSSSVSGVEFQVVFVIVFSNKKVCNVIYVYVVFFFEYYKSNSL